MALPWIEELLMVLVTTLVFIYTHFNLICAPSKKKKKVVAAPGKTANEASEAQRREQFRQKGPREEAPSRPPWDPAVPRTWEEVPGVTDSRFEGVILCFKPEDGYGFIKCKELYTRFSRDVFLHKAQVGKFDVGDRVSFGVFLNKQGLPQAKELEPGQADEAPPMPLPRAKPPEGQVAAPSALEEAKAEEESAPEEVVGYQQVTPLNPNAKEFTMPAIKMQAWDDVREKFRSLAGRWAGDRGSTYEVYFYSNPEVGQPIGSVLRTRPGETPKSIPLVWEPLTGFLHLKDKFSMQASSFTEDCKMTTWWRGQSKFVWQRLGPISPLRVPKEEKDWHAVKGNWGNSEANYNQEEDWHGAKSTWGGTEAYYTKENDWGSCSAKASWGDNKTYYQQQQQQQYETWGQNWAEGKKAWRSTGTWERSAETWEQEKATEDKDWWKWPEAERPEGEESCSKQWPARSQTAPRKWVRKE